MRGDRKYIDRATGLILCVTVDGRSHLDEMSLLHASNPFLARSCKRFDELLMIVQEEWIEVDDGSPAREWYYKFRKEYEEQMKKTPETTLRDFEEAIHLGYLSIRKVIWEHVKFKKGRRGWQSS